MELEMGLTLSEGLSPRKWFESYILRPSGVGAVTDINTQVPATGEHWDKVDEDPANDSDYVLQTDIINGIFKDDVYLIPDTIFSGDIGSIEVYMRLRRGTSVSVRGKVTIRTHELLYYGSEEALGVTFENFYKEWTNNPNTSAPWTWTEILDLQIGVSLKSDKNLGNNAYCSQVYVEINPPT